MELTKKELKAFYDTVRFFNEQRRQKARLEKIEKLKKYLFIFFISFVSLFCLAEECDFLKHQQKSYPVDFSVVKEQFTEEELVALDKAVNFWNSYFHEDMLRITLYSHNLIEKGKIRIFKNNPKVQARVVLGDQGIVVRFKESDFAEGYFQKVAIHEFGHVLGLNHNDDPDSIMYPVIDDPFVDDIDLRREAMCLNERLFNG